ncbi:hypothetical protein AB2B38_006805 [Balneola sp. MJW-20]|uniref:hypothetical protein n=1 Tax=Gracilimonas aurantiaca TaxID=3234185 RepID=UPI0034669C3F
MNQLKQVLSALVVLLILFGSTGYAQDQSVTEYAYVADFKINYGDMMDWMESHYEYTVPVLNSLQEDGIITGWSVWQHNTGSDYNWRMVFNTSGWANINNFWNTYFERMPAEAMESSMGMIEAHRDNIYVSAAYQYAEDANIKYAYESQFHINFSDLEAWNEVWAEKMKPVIEGQMSSGNSAGYYIGDHSTGNKYNRIQVYFFEDWDHIDDFNAALMGSMLSDPEEWKTTGSLVQSHDDIIWELVPYEIAAE